MRTLVIGILLSGGLLFAACGSGPPTATTTSTTVTTAPVATSPATTTSTTPTTTAASSPPSSSSANVPAVANGTDLSKEPVLSPGVSPAPTQLETRDLVVGTGATATTTSTVVVKYVGAAYATGTDFTQSTWTSGQSTTFSLHGGVIQGFSEGITGMRVGGRREMVIPSSLGYGATGQGTIKPNETLVFVVDLITIKKS